MSSKRRRDSASWAEGAHATEGESAVTEASTIHPSTESEHRYHLDSSSSHTNTQLTYPNLIELQADDSLPKNLQFPQPFDSVPRAEHLSPLDPDQESSISASKSHSESSMTTPTQAEKKLAGYRFFMDRGTPLPAELAVLISDITQPRPSLTITPNSKHVASVNDATKYMLENNAKHVLLDRLIYPVKLNYQDPNDEGEALIWRGMDDPWNDLIPKPQGGSVKEERVLQEAMEIIGSPSKPTPDADYGCPDESIESSSIAHLRAWYPGTLVYEYPPWFPYLVVEWKGRDKTIQEARFQARRDCPTAIEALYKTFIAGGKMEPPTKSTSIFSTLRRL